MLLLHWELPFPIEMVHFSAIPPAVVPPLGFATVTEASLTHFPLRQSDLWVEILRAGESRRSKQQEIKATDRGTAWNGIKMSVMSKNSSNVNYEIIREKSYFICLDIYCNTEAQGHKATVGYGLQDVFLYKEARRKDSKETHGLCIQAIRKAGQLTKPKVRQWRNCSHREKETENITTPHSFKLSTSTKQVAASAILTARM